ncbi:hypothetical protein H9Q69_007212 [Fusarium xylarioides]|nr:hypothetical protein H9Q69_007212 [Fusarium xylarioides]
MDPLSITSAAVALAATVYRCAIEVKKIVGTIADAADTLSDLAEEAQLIQGALQGVEDALQYNQEAISRYKVEEVFSIAVKGCRATLACIKQEFELLFNRRDWKARFMVLWKEDDMKKLLGRLDRKRESISLLLQLLSLSSGREVQALVAKKQTTLSVAKQDITALMPTYWTCRDTILDSLDKETVDSIYADWDNLESKLSTTEFDFDYELINTRAYHRALSQAQAKRKPELPSRDLGTPGQEPKAGIIEPVEDLIDLSYEPSQQGVSMSSHMLSMSYMDLAGLQFMPRTVDEGPDSPEGFNSCQTTEPPDMIESDLSPESKDKGSRDRTPTMRRWIQIKNKDAVTGIKQDESQQGAGLTGTTPVTTDTFRTKATKPQTPFVVEYFEGGKSLKVPTVRVRLAPSKRKIVITKAHPEVSETSRVDRASHSASDEPLDDSPRAPNIGHFSLEKGLSDLEAKHGPGRRRRASPRRSARISDETRQNRIRTRVPNKKKPNDPKYQSYDSGYTQDDDVRPRNRNLGHPKGKQRQSSQSADSTEVNPGTPPNTNNPRLLKTVKDAIQRLISPELNLKRELYAKREAAQRGRRITGGEGFRYMGLDKASKKGEPKRKQALHRPSRTDDSNEDR